MKYVPSPCNVVLNKHFARCSFTRTINGLRVQMHGIFYFTFGTILRSNLTIHCYPFGIIPTCKRVLDDVKASKGLSGLIAHIHLLHVVFPQEILLVLEKATLWTNSSTGDCFNMRKCLSTIIYIFVEDLYKSHRMSRCVP